MKRKKKIKKGIIIPIVGLTVLLFIAVFCYNSVEQMIIKNEQESMKSLAKVSAESMKKSLEEKENLISALFSQDMEDEREIEAALLKTRTKGKYIAKSQVTDQKDWVIDKCEEAADKPWDVIVGPILKTETGNYVLYMTKAVSVQGYISGYARIEIDLDEFYREEQALSSLALDHSKYCIIKDSNGTTVMPSDYSDNNISISQQTENGCTIEWVYETNGVTPERKQKLIAYETIAIGEEELYLYIVEDYDKITKPIEQISLYLSLIGLVIFIFTIGFMYKLAEQQKKEVVLEKELQHEKTLNETMKKQEGLMQKYNHPKTMSVLTGAIAHEFNNLMTPIVLYTELLEDNETIREEMAEEIEELKSATLRCEELARQLLSYSRQGKVEKVLTDYDATYAVNEAVSIVKKLVPSNIELKVNICKTSYMIHGQVGALNQIILNLVTNAFHAMEEGGQLTVSFGLSTTDDRYVRLIVEDTGCGIPREIQRKVFQPFFTTKNTGKGTGIGLTVVKRLTEEHGGNVFAKSEEGKGTTFILEFPRTL